MTACIGEPISWPRLERFAAGSGDAVVAAHVEACPACRACLDGLRADVVELPPLIAVAKPVARRRRWLAPVMGAAVAAMVAVIVLVRRPPQLAVGVVGIKGVGDVTLELVRERRGAISFDARRYAPGDRWKVVVSCPPGPEVAVDVSVADGATVDHPLAAVLACGNRVPVPGAFTITGNAPNRICVRIVAGDSGEACTTVTPD